MMSSRAVVVLVMIGVLILVLGAACAIAADLTDLSHARTRLVSPEADAVLPRAGSVGGTKADADTIYVLGGPGRLDGRFQDEDGNPDWQGWTSVDGNYMPSYWQASEFMAVNGQYSAWCGTYFGDDPGYGDYWDQQMVFRHAVDDPTVATEVHWTAVLRNDTEQGFDYTRFEVNKGGIWQSLLDVTGDWGPDTIDLTATYQPIEYVGSGGDEIQLRIRITSDVAFSDQDGQIDTNGACQLDDVIVRLDGSIVDSEDFESGTLGDWEGLEILVGDFAALWSDLNDLDLCVTNTSPQVAFIDDGIVVPGTGGTPGQTWRYGPGGYIVNNSGGLMGPDWVLYNWIESPVLDWPVDAIAGELRFDVYVHEPWEPGSAGITYAWLVRSTSDPIDEPIEFQPWRWNGWLGIGGPYYVREQGYYAELTSYLETGAVQVQVQLAVLDHDLFNGTDGTPAPYFDNVAVVATQLNGPAISYDNGSTASDGFPAVGDIDLVEPANNSVRFDMSAAIYGTDGLPTFGDALEIDCQALRDGAVLEGAPRLVVAMKANPVFDPYRTLPAGFTQEGSLISGEVEGWSSGQDEFAFDLPDTGFFYPGDVIHFFYEAQDNAAGDIGTSRLPQDTTGFHDFSDRSRYEDYFTTRALPSLRSLSQGDQPSVLLWVDSHELDQWQLTLGNLGYRLGEDYDLFYTLWPYAGNNDGLGGRATSAVLGGYSTLLYGGGDLWHVDVLLLGAWLERGEKNALLTGGHLVADLAGGGADDWAFINTYLGVDYLGDDVGELMGNQRTLHAQPVSGSGVVLRTDEWLVHGGCPAPRSFDAIQPVGSSVTIAEFLDPSGNGGQYPYAAGVYHLDTPHDAEVIVLPYNLTTIGAAPGVAPPPEYDGMVTEVVILEDILTIFGEQSLGSPIAAPDVGEFTVRAAPNPFNPRVTIDLALPRAGEVDVRIYSVRGELVRTLHRGHLEAGSHRLVWQGRNDAGRPVGSGLYFCETVADGQTDVRRLTLIR
jgi:hypothetical protein